MAGSATRPGQMNVTDNRSDPTYIEKFKNLYPTSEWQGRFSQAVYSWR